jgi:hypothetical protein
MNKIAQVIVYIVLASSTACYQGVEENLVGSWYLHTNYHFQIRLSILCI